MPQRKFMTTRVRALPIRIMVNEREKKLLQRVARGLDVPVSRFVREAALKRAAEPRGADNDVDPGA